MRAMIDRENTLSFGHYCHLPYGKAVIFSEHARVFWYEIAEYRTFSVFKLFPSEIVK